MISLSYWLFAGWNLAHFIICRWRFTPKDQKVTLICNKSWSRNTPQKSSGGLFDAVSFLFLPFPSPSLSTWPMFSGIPRSSIAFGKMPSMWSMLLKRKQFDAAWYPSLKWRLSPSLKKAAWMAFPTKVSWMNEGKIMGNMWKYIEMTSDHTDLVYNWPILPIGWLIMIDTKSLVTRCRILHLWAPRQNIIIASVWINGFTCLDIQTGCDAMVKLQALELSAPSWSSLAFCRRWDVGMSRLTRDP